MRWGYLLPRLLIVACVWAFLAFGFDPLVRRGLITSGEQVTGSRIEIGGLRTGFFPPSLETSHVRVANRFSPGTNLIEFDELRVQFASRPLLQRAFVVDEGSISGLRWGTPRDDSGLVDRNLNIKLWSRDPFEALGHRAAEVGKEWLSMLGDQARQQLDPNKLESVQTAKQRRDQWIVRFERLQLRADQLKGRIEDLQQTVKTKGNTLERIQAYRQAAADVNALLLESKRIRRELSTLAPRVQQDLRDIDAARQRDLQNIRQQLALFRPDPQAISELLMGPELANRLAETVRWAQWAKENVGWALHEPEPERLRGVDVVFKREQRLPRFLIRTLNVSGEATVGGKRLPFEGTVTGLTSEPTVYGKPTVIRIAGERGGSFQIEVSIDQTVVPAVHNLQMAYTIPSPTKTTLGDPNSLALRVTARRMQYNANLQLTGDRLSGDISLVLEPVELVADTRSDDVTRILASVLRGIRRLDAAVAVSGTLDSPDWQLRCDLGPQLVAGLNDVLSREIDERSQELARQINAAAGEQMAELRNMLNQRYADLLADLNLSDSHARQLVERAVGRPLGGLDKLFRR